MESATNKCLRDCVRSILGLSNSTSKKLVNGARTKIWASQLLPNVNHSNYAFVWECVYLCAVDWVSLEDFSWRKFYSHTF